MSTEEEIREVYEGDIAKQTRIVFSRCGAAPFMDGVPSGFKKEHIFDGLLNEDDRDFLTRILTDDSADS